MEGNRRQFLGSVAALSATGALLPSALGAEVPELALAADTDWNMTWRDRVKGPSRAGGDNPVVNECAGLWRAADWKETVPKVYKAKDKDVSAVLVIRHQAIPMIMNHEFCARHEIGAEMKHNDSSGSPVTYNP